MQVEVNWTRQARNDLLELYVLIGREQPLAAERYFDKIEAKVALLSEHPRLGIRRPEIRTNLRVMVEHPYIILYRTEPDTDEGVIKFVEIMSIIDGRRDIAKIF